MNYLEAYHISCFKYESQIKNTNRLIKYILDYSKNQIFLLVFKNISNN